MIPASLVRIGSIAAERLRLSRTRSTTCNTVALGTLDDPRAMFDCTQYDNEWHRVEPELTLFSIPDTAGGVNPGDRRALYYLARHLRPRLVLEIGTHIGASTVHICAALRALRGLAKAALPRLVTVDIEDVNDVRRRPWKRFGSRYSPEEMIARLGCRDLVSFVTDNSIDYLATCSETYDLIFLDGDHAASAVYAEIAAASAVLNRGGYIVLHDYFPNLQPLWSDGAVIPGPCLAIERHLREGADIEISPLGRLPWKTKLNSDVTSLALLSRRATS